jgi:hypothetical protein
MARNSKQVAHANVRTAQGVVPVRFIKSGKTFRATSRGLPRLRLTHDDASGEVIIKAHADGHQQTLRVTVPMDRAFGTAVKTFWQ